MPEGVVALHLASVGAPLGAHAHVEERAVVNHLVPHHLRSLPLPLLKEGRLITAVRRPLPFRGGLGRGFPSIPEPLANGVHLLVRRMQRAEVGREAQQVLARGAAPHVVVQVAAAVAAGDDDGLGEVFAQRVQDGVDEVLDVPPRLTWRRVVVPLQRSRHALLKLGKRKVFHREASPVPS